MLRNDTLLALKVLSTKFGGGGGESGGGAEFITTSVVEGYPNVVRVFVNLTVETRVTEEK